MIAGIMEMAQDNVADPQISRVKRLRSWFSKYMIMFFQNKTRQETVGVAMRNYFPAIQTQFQSAQANMAEVSRQAFADSTNKRMPWNGRDRKRQNNCGEQDSPDCRPAEIIKHSSAPYDKGVQRNHQGAMAIVVITDNFMHIAKSPKLQNAREYVNDELDDLLKVIKEAKYKTNPASITKTGEARLCAFADITPAAFTVSGEAGPPAFVATPERKDRAGGQEGNTNGAPQG